MADNLHLSRLDRGFMAGAANSSGSGGRTLSAQPPILDVRLLRRIHDGLTIDVTLRLGTEIGVLFGPSGSGKTSILRLITGLARPDAGSVRLDGALLFDSDKGVQEPLRRRRIGMIFQDDLLFPHLCVGENICFGLREAPRTAREARVAEVAALCGVEHLLDRRPDTLSGGERQRVGLARTLAPRPRLLLCDEPVSALDLPNRRTLIERLRAVQRALEIPVLYVTHSPAEAIDVGRRLFLLERGRILAEGPPLDVLAGAGEPSLAHLEGVSNRLPAQVEEHLPRHGATQLRLDDGPVLIVPFLESQLGTTAVVEVRADDILLARGPISGLSAQNLIQGRVERVVRHGSEAEVLIRTGGVTWIVSVVAPAVEQLSLSPGIDVHMIIKARSCHVIPSLTLSADRS
jgi:molybdate transport system ATP-binding protein